MRLEKMAFFHHSSIITWKNAPEVILIDTTHKTNRFRMPLVNIVGANANNKSFFIGAALIQSENTATFEWLLRLVRELYDRYGLAPPRVIITDADEALASAIRVVFPRPQT